MRASVLLLLLLLLLLLCACTTPSPQMMGASRHDIRLQGLAFAVFHKDDRAEVVRLDFVARPSMVRIRPLMEQAAVQATGCRVIPFSGTSVVSRDTGVISFDLDCGMPLSLRPGT